MHSKIKGNIGQFAVAKELARLGYSIFTEEGDISKIDLIAEKNGTIIRIQCKSITPKNGCMSIRFEKWGPNYRFHYDSDMFDFFGVYDMTNDKVYLIPSNVIGKNSSSFNLRVEAAKNNQNQSIHSCNEYLPEAILGKSGPLS